MDLEIRSAEAGDEAAVTGFSEDSRLHTEFSDWVGDGVSLVAESDVDGVVGYVHLHVFPSEEAWVEVLSVAEGRRGEGVGSRLVEAAVEEAEEAGIDVVRCEAGEDSGVQGFAESLGFEVAAEIHLARGFGFPYGSQLEPAQFDASLDTISDTDVYERLNGLYADTDGRFRELPESVEEFEDETVLGFSEDGEVRGAVVYCGRGVNRDAPENRSEFVCGFVWSEEDYAAQMALDVRGEARDRNLQDAAVYLPVDLVPSFDQAGYEVGGKRYVYRRRL